MTGDDHIWDEEKWEDFLNENDRRIERFMECFFQFLRDNPAPDADDVEAVKAWEKRLEAHIARKLGWKRGLDRLPFWNPEGEREDEAEAEDIFSVELNDVQGLPVFQHAHSLAQKVLEWSEALPGDVKDSALVQLCTNVMQIGGYIARGHRIGTERDAIGGYIASAKRALRCANTALDLLSEMQDAPYMESSVYRPLYEQTYEVRNQIGIYVQDLRGRFDLGVD